MIDLNHPLVKYLLTLKHSPKTDFSAGFINNQDAIILLFRAIGPFIGLKEVEEFAKEWRGREALGATYFGPHNGYTGKHFFYNGLFCGSCGPCSGAPRHKPFWYRAIMADPSKKQRFKNALTLVGMKRCEDLSREVPFEARCLVTFKEES
jgi:hypothetical protein